MSVSERHLSERTIGQLPLSVGTSLAIESALGIHPDIKVNAPPIRQYTEFWVNLKTLYRNMVGSLQADAMNQVLGVPVGEEIRHEMDRIDSMIGDEYNVKVVYYACNYNHLQQKYPNARIRMDTTAKQKLYTKTMMDALQHLILAEQPPAHLKIESRVRVFNTTLKPTVSVKTMILTHVPLDLCSAKHFGELTLLESHTGAIKEKAQWYTKYLQGKDLTRMPFREDLLQIFGDHEMFHPYPIEQRRELMEVAEKYKWTSLTTIDKLRYSIEQLKNPYFKAKLKAMLVP
jgi:hypothetical protein